MTLKTFFGLASVLLMLGTAGNAQSPHGEGVPAYVGSQICADCHTDAYDAWQTSHHGEAWRVPGEDSFEGAFEGESFEHDGMLAAFSKTGDTYVVTVQEKDGIEAVYEMHSVGGVHPLEHPILSTGKGRLQSFDVVWDVDQQRWYHLYPDQDLPPEDAFHWTGVYKNWNSRCAECHATGFEKNYDFSTRRYASTQAEIGVGCEACHGPAAAHLQIVDGEKPERFSVDLDKWGFTAQMSEPVAAMEQCAGCHARREGFGNGNPLPGEAFADNYNLAMLRPGLYHADGQILDEVYVYGSFLQSKMSQKGVTCANCHDPHTAELVAESNAVCTQCHSPAGNPDFVSLRLADYEDVAHTNHPEGTEAAQCVSCHMVDKVYMGTDPRRDHSFRVPRPDLSDKLDSPNACTTCHDDKSNVWAAEQVKGWFPNGRWQEPHYGEVLALGRANPRSAAGDLLGLAQDEGQPNLVRATALWLLGPGATTLDLEDLAAFMENDDPQIRIGALNALRARAVVATAPYLLQGLNDDVRAVRLAAARAIMSQRPDRLPDSLRAGLGRAYREFGSVVQNQMDFAEAHLQVAGYSMVSGNIPSAIAALSEAVRLNPQSPQAWSSLIRMTAQVEGRSAAKKRMRQALAFNPDDPGLQALAEQF